MRRVSRSWLDSAVCGQTDPDVFHPEPGGRPGAVLRVCRSCPVRVACLDDALRTGDRGGIRGGLTPGMRRALHVAHDRGEQVDTATAVA